MATDPDFLDFAKDLFADLGPLKTKRMFGGTGMYCDGAMFAVLFNDAIYMKADPALSEEYIAAGGAPFVYAIKGGERKIAGLMSLPAAAMDDPEDAMSWAQKSMVPARAAALKKEKKPRKKRKPNKDRSPDDI